MSRRRGRRQRGGRTLIARGDDNTSIARRLGISPKTVRNHLTAIFTKLQVSDRARAIVRARQAGLGGVRTSVAAYAMHVVSPQQRPEL